MTSCDPKGQIWDFKCNISKTAGDAIYQQSIITRWPAVWQ